MGGGHCCGSFCKGIVALCQIVGGIGGIILLALELTRVSKEETIDSIQEQRNATWTPEELENAENYLRTKTMLYYAGLVGAISVPLMGIVLLVAVCYNRWCLVRVWAIWSILLCLLGIGLTTLGYMNQASAPAPTEAGSSWLSLFPLLIVLVLEAFSIMFVCFCQEDKHEDRKPLIKPRK